MSFPIKCYACGNAFDTLKVTAALKCARCGSDDIDLDDRTASSPGTGWNQPRPDRLEGWNDYAGPLPGRNPAAGQNLVGDNTTTCQACGGTGVDTRASGGGYNEVPCRNCHGTGQQATHHTDPGSVNDATTSGPPVGGARYTANVTTSPFTWTTGSSNFTNSNSVTYTVTYPKQAGRRSSDPMGSADDYIRGTDPDYDNRSGDVRKADTRAPELKYRQNHPYSHGTKPLPLSGAKCPSCGNSNTQLIRDSKDEAWWHCPNCGSLANVDRNPEVNPFNPPADFKPDRDFEKKKRVAFRRKKEEPKTGKALKMVHATLQTNPGLTVGQALTLVRNALAKYPE
jgi:predicted Zn-ribbon and HTH transcriptional regulator